MARTSTQHPLSPGSRKLAENPILIIITVAIALVGGVPGAISIYKEWVNKAKFDINMPILRTGQEVDSTGKLTNTSLIAIAGSLRNDGTKPIYPAYFTAKILSESGEKQLRTYVKKGIGTTALLDLMRAVDIKESYKSDFNLVKQITPGEIVYGYLIFSYPTNVNDLENETIKFELTCIDASGETFIVKIPMYISPQDKGPFSIPK